MYGEKELNALPKDVKNSLKKIEKLLSIIDDNYYKGKDYTIVELIGEFGSLERARKIFNLYYFLDSIGISKYISEIRKSKLKNTKASIPLIDIDTITSNIVSIYDNIIKLDENGYAKVNIKRTNISVARREKFLKEILTMREYIYTEETDDIEKLVEYNLFLEDYEYMDEQMKKSTNYNTNPIVDAFVNSQNKSKEEEKQIRMAEFLICRDDYLKVRVDYLVYYVFDRSKYKSDIEKLTLPNDLNKYVTICSKSHYATKLLSRRISLWYQCQDRFDLMIDNRLEKMVFFYMTKREDTGEEMTLEEIYQELKKGNKYLKKIDVQNALKSLIIRGFVSLKR